MNRNIVISFVALILAAIGFFFFQATKQVNDAITFNDIEVETNENVLSQIAEGYVTLPSISADEDAIVDLIGAIVIRTRTNNGDEWSYNMRFRPLRESIQTKIVGEQLFHGIVSAKADFGGRFEIASGDTVAEELAETTIKNQLIVGYKDQSGIPFQSLSQLSVTPDKDYFFVERVVVTDITTRRFRKHTVGGKIEGMAFGANGATYSERGAVRTRKVVSFRPIHVLDLQASEAGSGDKATKLAAKSRREQLSSDEAAALIKTLVEKAKDIAPVSAPLRRPQAGLPERLRGMDQIVWIDDLSPRRQSSPNRCWAATTAILFTWQKGREVDELEAVTSLGPIWVTQYDRDVALPKSYKFDFLTAAGFKYSAPQSYAPQGLISLLKDHGPVWFTIDKKFGRHATVLTGVFLDRQEEEHWVSYIDPADGSLKADTYVSYMRRYEAPAYRANEEGIKVAKTERDLDIQVIHW